jgi:hypothetical protein
MGTNFFLKENVRKSFLELLKRNEPGKVEYYEKEDIHIGKRSAAGWFCWDCKKSLCLNGDDFVHSHKDQYGTEVRMSEICVYCGLSVPKDAKLFEGAVGRELGFEIEKPKHEGIETVSSFCFSIPPYILKRALAHFAIEAIANKEEWDKIKTIYDEYGREYTNIEFFDDVLGECPITFVDMIWRQFS